MIPLLVTTGVSLALLLATPDAAWAWGPPTHAFIGSRILENLAVLPVLVRELLKAYPWQYLYGNLAADIALGQRYVPYTRHCHNWEVGFTILDHSETPPQQAFALGYLSHLAADTIAHNVFVPRQLAATPHATRLGHTYWEYRFDSETGDEFLRLAREIVTSDHEEADALLERVITQAFFSFQTNKRIYQQIIHLSNRERWNTLWVRMADRSRWDLPSERVDGLSRLSIAYVEDLLRLGAESLSQRLDPTGSERLALAKKLRRQSFRTARREVGRELTAAPLSSISMEDAARLVKTRPIPPEEMEMLAAIFFPDPAWPARSAEGNGLDVEGQTDFWAAFSGARPVSAAS
ncbi:MAG: zinc dependent phospholipase C family protein [Gemmatimonadota bacterium]